MVGSIKIKFGTNFCCSDELKFPKNEHCWDSGDYTFRSSHLSGLLWPRGFIYCGLSAPGSWEHRYFFLLLQCRCVSSH